MIQLSGALLNGVGSPKENHRSLNLAQVVGLQVLPNDLGSIKGFYRVLEKVSVGSYKRFLWDSV